MIPRPSATIPSRVGSRVLVVLVLAAVACGGGSGDEAVFPSRDWSGPYVLEVVEASTDCVEADPPLWEMSSSMSVIGRERGHAPDGP